MDLSRERLTPGMYRERQAASRMCCNRGSAEDLLILILRAYMRKHPSKAEAFTASLGGLGVLLC